MAQEREKLHGCTCLAIRQAARHVTQFYDQFLAQAGLRTTQYSVLANLRRHGPTTINALAAHLVMDRTTLGRNILPLQRQGLIATEKDETDRRSKKLRLSDEGLARLRASGKLWSQAQAQFEATFGGKRTADLHVLLRGVTASNLAATPDRSAI